MGLIRTYQEEIELTMDEVGEALTAYTEEKYNIKVYPSDWMFVGPYWHGGSEGELDVWKAKAETQGEFERTSNDG